jgi:hypothetical protein
LHVPSLTILQSGVSFKLLPSEQENLDDGELHHPTATATCLTSLFECPQRYRTAEFKRAEAVRAGFSEAAFRRKSKKWISEGSAGVYCRCRALPTVVSFSDSFDASIKTHLKEILGQLDKMPDRFAIGPVVPSQRISHLLDLGAHTSDTAQGPERVQKPS